jgi:PHD/YefM family antitoxin component YafN of YafNO toxin-antitoxin module
MIPVLPSRPVTDMNRVPSDVLAMLTNNPVVLMQRSQPAAVMVHPDQWNAIAEELRRFRVIAEARRIEARNDASNSWTSGEEMRRMMAERGVNVGD